MRFLFCLNCRYQPGITLGGGQLRQPRRWPYQARESGRVLSAGPSRTVPRPCLDKGPRPSHINTLPTHVSGPKYPSLRPPVRTVLLGDSPRARAEMCLSWRKCGGRGMEVGTSEGIRGRLMRQGALWLEDHSGLRSGSTVCVDVGDGVGEVSLRLHITSSRFVFKLPLGRTSSSPISIRILVDARHEGTLWKLKTRITADPRITAKPGLTAEPRLIAGSRLTTSWPWRQPRTQD